MATTNSKKYFDVSKPGKTPASATSRPVIVTNRSIVKDPTLKEEDDNEESRSPLLKTASKVIAPPQAVDSDPPEEPVKDESAPPEPDKTKPEPTEAKEPEAETTQEEEPANTPEVDNQIDPGRKDEKQAEELNEAEKAKQEHLDKLVASGKYAVPIGHIKRNRRVRRTLGITVVLLLLVAAGIFLLVDAGIIKTSITLPIDLIHN